ncbi:MAG: glucose-6-phosphate isomerase [Prevotellaceae bacterium]|jgi:glucose-6-phosphate isomerase|nr:glucose-6-phosphate isomerase [Prevotellaceae bacterium]
MIKIDLTAALPFCSAADFTNESLRASKALKTLTEGTGAGSDFLGWVKPSKYLQISELTMINEVAEELSHNIDVVVVIGIGGSYLGAKAVIEALSHSYHSLLPQRKHPIVLFAGHQMSQDYLWELLEMMQHYSCACVVISKSGTTTEPALAFRLIKKHIEEKYGAELAKKRIVAITDATKGALRGLAEQEGYRTFVIPNDIGGRFSVFTPVGLLPMAIAGVDVPMLINGVIEQEGMSLCNDPDNPSIQYAAIRNALHKKGKLIEILANFEPKLHYVTEWWKQLYGESEGKEGIGIFPAGVDFTTDLHSMGQYIQDGPRFLMETVLSVAKPKQNVVINSQADDLDGLNYLVGKNIDFCNKMAEKGTIMAHVDGGVPNIHIQIPVLDARSIGALLYFFEVACGISGYMLGVNPFDQPGVEAYKKNMFALLRKGTS